MTSRPYVGSEMNFLTAIFSVEKSDDVVDPGVKNCMKLSDVIYRRSFRTLFLDWRVATHFGLQAVPYGSPKPEL